jgi:hypothetical protein
MVTGLVSGWYHTNVAVCPVPDDAARTFVSSEVVKTAKVAKLRL